MKLQTTIPVSPESNQIDYSSSVLLLGSCFTENIGAKLEYFKFRNLQNPFGILFHPLAIEQLLSRAVENRGFTQADLFHRDGIWHSFEVHSLVNATTSEEMVSLLNKKLVALKDAMASASHIVLTFGTAWVYRHLTSNTVVANCHKVPNKEFSKELLSVAEVTNSVEKIKGFVQMINPTTQLISTVSPVRHLKDGLVENSLSKAHLLTGIHAVEGMHYFPSYELMMDEMRDYRFYTSDLLHPNETAIELIWERFQSAWVDPKTAVLQREIDVVQKGLLHRPFHPNSEAHKQFLKSLDEKIAALKVRLPYLQFTK